ncbi:MAG: FecR domain-containing protein [Byssovorax sp.]
MSIEPCETMRLVEARYDGRLGEREAAALDRHVLTCDACRAHTEDLPRLRAIAEEHPAPQTPLEQQRSRARLLSEAARIEPRGVPRARPAWTTALVLAAAMFAAGYVGWLLRTPPTANNAAPSEPASTNVALTAPSASAPARFATTVAPERGARFAQRTEGGAETVTLDEGAATFVVRPLAKGERFLIKTADGEISLAGASVRVEAQGSKVRTVTVQEGKAEVRYSGAVFELSAGSTWSPPVDTAAPASATPAVDPATPAAAAADPRLGRASIAAPGARPTARVVVTRPAPAPAATTPVNEPVVAAVAPPAPPKAEVGATDFADAVHLFERGDYPTAAQHLAEFSSAHPGDGRGEDAAFLAILSLQRTGKTAEAAAAAQRYLQAYPKGYRRAEAVKIAASH